MTAGRVIAWVALVLLTLLYAYVVVTGVGNLTGISELAGVLGFAVSPAGWFWLTLGILLPIAVYAVALLFGRGRAAGVRVLLLATGLAVVGAIQLEILHLVPQTSFFA